MNDERAIQQITARRFQELEAERDAAIQMSEAWQGRVQDLTKERKVLVDALRYMADYKMTGTEQTLHIDFQGKARDVLARIGEGTVRDSKVIDRYDVEWYAK